MRWLERFGLPARARVGVLGLGQEGMATLRFLLDEGCERVHVFDAALPGTQNEHWLALRGHPRVVLHAEEDWQRALARCAVVFRGPRVPPRSIPEGPRVLGATQLFLALARGMVVGVTGTAGKGTTVGLVAAGLGAEGVPVRVGGNVGLNPLAFVGALGPRSVTVLELSSFQLADWPHAQRYVRGSEQGLEKGLWPSVAVVLRTTAEHLDWHPDVADYWRAKARIVAPSEELSGGAQRVIAMAESAGSLAITTRAQRRWLVSLRRAVRDGVGWKNSAGGFADYHQGEMGRCLPWLQQLRLPGRFNIENAAAAFLVLRSLGCAGWRAVSAWQRFEGLPHRLAYAGEVRGVRCYNDSYATRPEATQAALEAFGRRPLALILGGSEKHADFSALARRLCVPSVGVRRVMLMGSTAERLAEAIAEAAAFFGGVAPEVIHANSLEAAADGALASLPAGGVLLFSPACASFDMFSDYRVRGERFIAWVRRQEVAS